MSERHGKAYLISVWDSAFKGASNSLVQNHECIDYVLMLLPSFLPSFLFKQSSQLSPPLPPPHQAKEEKSKKRREEVLASFLSLGKFLRSFLLKISPLWLGGSRGTT